MKLVAIFAFTPLLLKTLFIALSVSVVIGVCITDVTI